MRNTLFAGFACLLLAGSAIGQAHDNVWARFVSSPSSLSAGTISDNSTETDVDWGDLDQNGYIDVVVVRKQEFTSVGKRTNILLMNYDGVLTDMTTTFAATSSDVPGDTGFRTPTNDRDVVVSDVDGDGWLDVITATTISDSDPKHIGHPRVYLNLGDDINGDWQGLDFQDVRIPQFLHFTSGAPLNPRFCSVDAGDLTGNGSVDLYFGDYDSSGAGGSQQPGASDLNDRLLINDGAGFFSDDSQLRMSSQMLLSAFGTSVVIDDMNGDGRNDVIKDTALNAPQYVSISYNNLLGAGTHGMFNSFDNSENGSGAPYFAETGDLNADGRPDIITSDDGQDRYRINLGNDALERAEFSGGSGGHPYSYVEGGDTGFASNNLIVDINNDGWGDAVYADVDVDIPSSNRMHIYHNAGPQEGTPVGGIPTMREEFGDASGNWIGAKGLLNADLQAVHDFAAADFNNDGWTDLLISREGGTFVWLQEALVAQVDLGFGGPGNVNLSVIGDDLTEDDSVARYQVTGAGASATVFNVLGLSSTPTPFKGGTLVPIPVLQILPTLADGNGTIAFNVRGGSASPVSVFAQSVWDNGSNFEFSNAVEIVIGF
ncbi:MAG: hypothetical protein DRQ55_17010 [Planctomycetota bacterium]|nr:MAG: hypothetical protein DRQ55_17010 [Planctomycetota bacterium]